MSRVHKHNSKAIDGRACDFHETRVAFLRVAGLLVKRRSASRSFSTFWMGSAPAFHRSRRSASGASIVALPSNAVGCVTVVIRKVLRPRHYRDRVTRLVIEMMTRRDEGHGPRGEVLLHP